MWNLGRSSYGRLDTSYDKKAVLAVYCLFKYITPITPYYEKKFILPRPKIIITEKCIKNF